jgi:hypothetical protein
LTAWNNGNYQLSIACARVRGDTDREHSDIDKKEKESTGDVVKAIAIIFVKRLDFTRYLSNGNKN